MQNRFGLLIQLGRDAYIHDHCLGYRHDYFLFYQFPNNNLFTHSMLFFKRESSSENYGPWVYFYHILKNPKNTLLQFYFIYFISYFCSIYLSITIQFNLTINSQRIDNPSYTLGCKFFCLCAGVVYIVFLGSPTGLITLVS